MKILTHLIFNRLFGLFYDCQLVIYNLSRFYDKQLMVTQGVNSDAWNILVKIKVNLGLSTLNILCVQVL